MNDERAPKKRVCDVSPLRPVAVWLGRAFVALRPRLPSSRNVPPPCPRPPSGSDSFAWQTRLHDVIITIITPHYIHTCMHVTTPNWTPYPLDFARATREDFAVLCATAATTVQAYAYNNKQHVVQPPYIHSYQQGIPVVYFCDALVTKMCYYYVVYSCSVAHTAHTEYFWGWYFCFPAISYFFFLTIISTVTTHSILLANETRRDKATIPLSSSSSVLLWAAMRERCGGMKQCGGG